MLKARNLGWVARFFIGVSGNTYAIALLEWQIPNNLSN